MSFKKSSVWRRLSRDAAAPNAMNTSNPSQTLIASSQDSRNNAAITQNRIISTASSYSTPAPSESRRKGSDKYGLFTLYNGLSDEQVVGTFPVDIVAVHGLNGEAYRTWTATDKKGNSTNWLRDFLPDEFPGSRIFTFGYPSEILNSIDTGDLDIAARNLLQALLDVRQRRHEQRPLIMMGHSMGGIVVKNALSLCATESDRYGALKTSITSVFFFATPHGGSAKAEQGLYASSVTKLLGSKVIRDDFLQVLRRDSSVLAMISDTFATQACDFDVYTFVEQARMHGSIIVTTESATLALPREKVFYMSGRNHRDIVQFSRRDQGYKLIVSQMSSAMDSSLNLFIQHVTIEDEKCLQSLAFPEMLTRQEVIQQSTNTIRSERPWISNNAIFTNWLETSETFLWIKGDPGTGKSTLMASLQHDINIHHSGHSKALIFFFDRAGSALQRAPLGMFRSMLHQMYQKSQLARSLILKMYEEKTTSFGKAGETWSWQLDELEALFVKVMSKATQQREFVILVDALDETGEEDQTVELTARKLVSYFHQLSKIVEMGHGKIKICISCRHYPNINVGNSSQIFVENENDAAMRSFVKRELSEHVEDWSEQSRLSREALVEMLLEKANRQFLWVGIRVPMVIKSLNDGVHSIKTVHELLESESSKLFDLYKSILTSNVSTNRQQESFMLLRWILLAQRPMQLVELRYALACEGLRLQGVTKIEDCKNFVESDERMRRLTRSLSGGLAVVMTAANGSHVRLMHETVYDFLRKGGLAMIVPSKLEKTLELHKESLAIGHDHLSKSCMTYLMSADVSHGIQNWETGDTKLFPFIQYATESWRKHASKAEHYGRPQTDYVAILNSSKELLNQLAMIHSHLVPHDLNIGADILNIAASCGLDSIVQDLLENGEQYEIPDQHVSALHCAARWSHESIVKLLLEAGADVAAKTFSGKTPIEIAAANSHTHIVQLLLKAAAMTGQKETYCNVLNAAAASGNIGLMKLLLENGADINAQNACGTTAAHEAAFNQQFTALQLLLGHGADVNLFGATHGTCLAAALCSMTAQDSPLISLLIDSGACINPLPGSGGGPLMTAITNHLAPLQTIAELLQRGADVNVQSDEFGSCLEAAAYRGDVDVVRLVMDHGAAINQVGRTGRCALHAAVSTAWADDVVWLLLERDADVQIKDAKDETILAAAAYSGNIAVAKKLLQLGIDVNQQDRAHGNALMAAASGPSGHMMVELLLKYGADIHAPGQKFGSVLEAAIYFHRTASMEVLIQHGAILAESRAPLGEPPLSLLNNYRTPLQIAALQGFSDIVQRLLDLGVDVNEPGRVQGDALHAAVFAGRVRVVQILLNNGANFDEQIAQRLLNTSKEKKEMHRFLSIYRHQLTQVTAAENGTEAYIIP